MNTKTMRLPPRRVLTPDKRIKQRDAVTEKPPEKFAVAKLPPPPQNHILPPVTSNYRKSLNAPATTATSGAEPVIGSNQLFLAGYLSHEFLTKGTIFGEQWNPARVQAGPVTVQPRKPKSKSSHDIEQNEPKRRRYLEVANLLRVEGPHLPGIVNPAQLARFLKL